MFDVIPVLLMSWPPDEGVVRSPAAVVP